MILRIWCQVYIATRFYFVRIVTLFVIIYPLCSAVYTSNLPPWASFAPAPPLKAVTVHIVATCLAKYNGFLLPFATISHHFLIAYWAVSIDVSLNNLCSCVKIWANLWSSSYIWGGRGWGGIGTQHINEVKWDNWIQNRPQHISDIHTEARPCPLFLQQTRVMYKPDNLDCSSKHEKSG